jgi:hypothetical protein
MMSIQPSEFWNMSPVEIYKAISGFKEFNGSANEPDTMSRDELEDLMELNPD